VLIVLSTWVTDERVRSACDQLRLLRPVLGWMRSRRSPIRQPTHHTRQPDPGLAKQGNPDLEMATMPPHQALRLARSRTNWAVDPRNAGTFVIRLCDCALSSADFLLFLGPRSSVVPAEFQNTPIAMSKEHSRTCLPIGIPVSNNHCRCPGHDSGRTRDLAVVDPVLARRVAFDQMRFSVFQVEF